MTDDARHVHHYDQTTKALRDIAGMVTVHRKGGRCVHTPSCPGKRVYDFLESLDADDLRDFASTALLVVADDAAELARLRVMEARLKELAHRTDGLRQRIAELHNADTLDLDAGRPPAGPEGDHHG